MCKQRSVKYPVEHGTHNTLMTEYSMHDPKHRLERAVADRMEYDVPAVNNSVIVMLHLEAYPLA